MTLRFETDKDKMGPKKGASCWTRRCIKCGESVALIYEDGNAGHAMGVPEFDKHPWKWYILNACLSRYVYKNCDCDEPNLL